MTGVQIVDIPIVNIHIFLFQSKIRILNSTVISYVQGAATDVAAAKKIIPDTVLTAVCTPGPSRYQTITKHGKKFTESKKTETCADAMKRRTT